MVWHLVDGEQAEQYVLHAHRDLQLHLGERRGHVPLRVGDARADQQDHHAPLLRLIELGRAFEERALLHDGREERREEVEEWLARRDDLIFRQRLGVGALRHLEREVLLLAHVVPEALRVRARVALRPGPLERARAEEEPREERDRAVAVLEQPLCDARELGLVRLGAREADRVEDRVVGIVLLGA